MKTVLKLLPILLLFVLTILFNIGLIDIRFDEIQYLLGSIASQDEVSNTFGIVAKYELIKQRMELGEENNSNYELEAKMQTLTSSDMENQKSKGTATIYRIPVRIVLNGIRLVLGKPLINPKEEDKIFSILEIAYFWERNRKYAEALKVYEEILLTASLQQSIRAAVLVHQAFCYSMLSNYEKSKLIYEDVISEFPNTEVGIVAWKLLDFIQMMEKERASVDNAKITGKEKARQFYLLMDFRNSIKYYSMYIGESSENRNSAEAHFFKGRSHEELGESEDAITEYRLVIKMDKEKTWARQANRRMLMLGDFYEQQKSISDEARRQLEVYQDQQFIKNMEMYSTLIPVSSLKNELMNEIGIKSTVGQSNDNILSLIDMIGTLELTGESEEKERDVAAMKKKLIESGSVNVVEMKELERKQNLNQNAYRRPTFLKNIIDKNSEELRYLYNRRLRSGIKLSGRMLVEFVIHPSGTIGSLRVVQSNMGDETFENEVVGRIQQWRFNAVPDSLGNLTINYPFEFYEEQ